MYASAYIWAKVIGRLEEQLTDIAVRALLDDAELVELTQEKLVLYSPSDFRQENIRERCAPYIHEALRELFHIQVKLEVWGDRELQAYKEETRQINAVLFNSRFSFDSFVTGQSNQIAARIALAAADNPGQEVYNPLFIYGQPGVGKTHLQYAIANHIMKKYPDKRVLCIRGDQFTNELINAIQMGKTAEFKQKYRRDADVLLIDDVQFIAGKERTQEEFFHTFNELYQHKKQIVMTADRKPSDMATLEERLRGRFGEGILVSIQPPDRETRLAIIKSKAAGLELELESGIVENLADNLTDNVRQIEGALKKLRAYRDLGSMELTAENVSRILSDICSPQSRMPITTALVIRNVCRYFGLDENTLKGSQKSKGVAEPRQIAMYLIRKLVKLSYTDIGREFGRDHGTVHHSVKKIEAAAQVRGSRLEGIVEDIISNIESSTG